MSRAADIAAIRAELDNGNITPRGLADVADIREEQARMIQDQPASVIAAAIVGLETLISRGVER